MQHSAVPGCAGKGESALHDFTDSAVDCGRERRLRPPQPSPGFWGSLPVFGQSHPGLVAGGVSPVGAAHLGQGDDFPDEVADLLEGAVGIFPAVGNDGPGGGSKDRESQVSLSVRSEIMLQHVLPKWV